MIGETEPDLTDRRIEDDSLVEVAEIADRDHEPAPDFDSLESLAVTCELPQSDLLSSSLDWSSTRVQLSDDSVTVQMLPDEVSNQFSLFNFI